MQHAIKSSTKLASFRVGYQCPQCTPPAHVPAPCSWSFLRSRRRPFRECQPIMTIAATPMMESVMNQIIAAQGPIVPTATTAAVVAVTRADMPMTANATCHNFAAVVTLRTVATRPTQVPRRLNAHILLQAARNCRTIAAAHIVVCAGRGGIVSNMHTTVRTTNIIALNSWRY